MVLFILESTVYKKYLKSLLLTLIMAQNFKKISHSWPQNLSQTNISLLIIRTQLMQKLLDGFISLNLEEIITYSMLLSQFFKGIQPEKA